MNFNGTITISILLALCALIAPSITAVINNRHNFKIRKLELQHDEHLHKADIQYRNKYDIYSAFINVAGQYSHFNNYAKNYTDMISHIQAALLLCDAETTPLLLEFQTLIHTSGASENEDVYSELLTSITKSFNRELTALSRTDDNK